MADSRDDADRLTEIREAVEEDFRLFGEPTKLRTTGRYEATHLLRQFDTTIAAKDAEIAALRAENERLKDGWKEATIAWSVCASIHREYAKGRDALYTTRHADFLKHETDARESLTPPQEPQG